MDKDRKDKTLLIGFCISAALNMIFLLFFGLAVSRKTASIMFENMNKKDDAYLTGACIVSVPEKGAGLVFGPAEFTLATGERAVYQVSAYLDGRQLNMAAEPLYDRAVVAVEKTGYGLCITALSPGEAVLQTITADGIRDLARVTVTPRKAAYPPHAGGQQVEAE